MDNSFNPGKKLFYLIPIGLVLGFLPYLVLLLAYDPLDPVLSATERNVLLTILMLASLYALPLGYDDFIYIFPSKRSLKLGCTIGLEALFAAMVAIIFTTLIGAVKGQGWIITSWIFGGILTLLLIILPTEINIAYAIRKAQK